MEFSEKKWDKRSIKRRMQEYAAKLWNVKKTDIDGFDPLVDMILGACSHELESIHHEIDSVEKRVLERLAQLLTPDSTRAAIPAHAVVYGRPTDVEFIAKRDLLLYYRLVSPIDQTSKEVFFSPIKPVQLKDVGITHVAFGNDFFSINGLDKEEKGRAKQGKYLDNSSIYLGLQLNENIESLKDLCFYFDWPYADKTLKGALLRYLGMANWSFNGASITMKEGQKYLTREELYKEILDEFDNNKRTESHVEALYKNHFFTIDQEFGIDPKAPLSIPQNLLDVFGEEVFSKLKGNYCWLKVSFPEQFPHQQLIDSFIQVNCFPIVNRRLMSIRHWTQQQINILPLQSDSYFFSIERVISRSGKEYHQEATIDLDTGKRDTYTLRQGGTARFDPRDAAAMMDYVFDLVKDESAAFSALGYNILKSEIRELHQNMSRIEKHSKAKGANKEAITYIILRSNETGEQVEVKFWVTDGEDGNNISRGSELIPFSGAHFQKDHLFFASETFGGRNLLMDKASLYSFKEALLSRGRVVTMEDIRTLCFSRLGAKIQNVSIEKGTMIGEGINQGLVRCIKIILIPKEGFEISMGDCVDLEVTLKEKSTSLMPFKVDSMNLKEKAIND